MAGYNKFNAFVADVANKVHNLGSDTLKIMLTNTVPVNTNAVYSDISGNELANGSGYTTGGVSLSSVTSTQSGGTYKLVAADPTAWTATGSMGPFQYAVLYNATASSKNLIGWWNYGTSVTLASGETFAVDLDNSAGILQLT